MSAGLSATRSMEEQCSNAGERVPLVKKVPVLTVDGGTGDTWAQFVEDAGYDFVLAIIIVKHLCIGFTSALVTPAASYIYRLYNVDAETVQTYHMASDFPFALQPLICSLSDECPIFGYHKAPYLLISIVVGSSAALALGASTLGQLDILFVVGCIMCTKAQTSTCNIILDAFATSKIRRLPHHDLKLAWFVKVGAFIMAVVGTVVCGVFLSNYPVGSVYLVAFPFFAIAAVPVVLGWLGEKPCNVGEEPDPDSPKPAIKVDVDQEALPLMTWQLSNAACLILVMAVLAPDPWVCVSVSHGAVVMVLCAFCWNLPPKLAKFFAFILITKAFDLGYGGAVYYFFTDTPQQYAQGPHFTPFFYTTTMRCVSMSCGCTGLMLYIRYMKWMSFRRVFLVCALVKVVSKVLDAALFTHTNRRLGVPDAAMVLGEDFVIPMVEALRSMPTMLLTARLAPKGMEVTMNGVVAGCDYIGWTVSQFTGALFLHVFDVSPSGIPDESEEFLHLWLLPVISTVSILVSHVGLLWLIPEGGPTDRHAQ